jgi:hypothetical protein
MPRIFPEKARHSVLSEVPTGPKLSQEKNTPSLPPANRMYLSVYSGYLYQVPFVYSYFKIGTVPNYTRYQSIRPPLTRCSWRPSARCWGRGGEYLEISTCFFRPKNRSGTVRDCTGFPLFFFLYLVVVHSIGFPFFSSYFLHKMECTSTALNRFT